MMLDPHQTRRGGEDDDGVVAELPRDVVGVMCSDLSWPDKHRQTRDYTMLALLRIALCRGMADPQNARVKDMLNEAATGVDAIDADMRGATFMMVLNCDDWLREFVCAEQHPNRGDTHRALPSHASRQFFVDLAVSCEEYADRRIDEGRFMQSVREAHARALKRWRRRALRPSRTTTASKCSAHRERGCASIPFFV